MGFLFFCVLLVIVFLLSQTTTKSLSQLLMHVLHSQSAAIHVLAFLFLPGVVLHELSHLLVANMLLVPTGEVEFFPEIHGNQVKMGSVAIAKTDPLRRFLIGVAPVIGGIGVLLLLAVYMSSFILSWQTLLFFYCLFEVTNTMFSSSKDMEGSLAFAAAAIVLLVSLQVLGLPVWDFFLQHVLSISWGNFFQRINIFLFFAVGIDGLLIFLCVGALRIFRRSY